MVEKVLIRTQEFHTLMSKIPKHLLGRLFGTYGVQSLIAESPHCWICRAQEETGRDVVLKVLKPGVDAHAVLRLYNQARQSMHIAHPGISPVLEVGQDGDLHFMALELVAGHDLWKRMALVHSFPPVVAVRTIVSIAFVLDALHASGIVHRALTPDHVLFTADDRSRLIGLGYAYDTVDNTDYCHGKVRNDWALAPEVRTSSARPTPLSDVYSLGALLLFMLTGRVVGQPTDTITIQRVLAAVAQQHSGGTADALSALLHRALAANPRDRQQSAWQFAQGACQAVHRDIRCDWSAPPLAVAAEEDSTAARSWYVMAPSGNSGRQLMKGDRRSVVRSLLRGRLTGAELASPGLSRVFRPLSEITDFAQALRLATSF